MFFYKDLGSDELFKKCWHCQTQNVNESRNNLIWTRCPKRVYVGNSVFKTSVASAVIASNDGAIGLIPVFKILGTDCGYCTSEENRKVDCLRIKNSDHKSAERVKKRLKQLRAIRKGFADKNELEKGETYGMWAIISMFCQHKIICFSFFATLLFRQILIFQKG